MNWRGTFMDIFSMYVVINVFTVCHFITHVACLVYSTICLVSN